MIVSDDFRIAVITLRVKEIMHVGELYLGNYTRGRGRVNPDNGTDWKEIKQMFGEKKTQVYP